MMGYADTKKLPFHVVLVGVESWDRAFVTGFESEDEAAKDAAARTERGKAFKSKPEYKVIPRPA